MSKVLENKEETVDDIYRSVKEQVEKIYENYGCDIEDMNEEEFKKVIEHYINNKDDLEKDFESSKKHMNVHLSNF